MLFAKIATIGILTGGGAESTCRDLTSWKHEGGVRVTKESAVFVGPGSIQCKIKVAGLDVIYVEVTTSVPSQESHFLLSATCLSGSGKALYRVETSHKAEAQDLKLCLYFKTHPSTKSVLIYCLHRGSESGNVSGVVIRNDSLNRSTKKPEIDLDEYTRPLSRGPIAYDETVIFIGEKDLELRARLLFESSEILSVTDSSRRVRYEAGRDYRVDNNEIIRLPDSRMPIVEPQSLPSGELAWYLIGREHVLLTYKHNTSFQGKLFSPSPPSLPRMVKKLKAKAPVKILAVGDSITLGTGTSGFENRPPYMPAWPDLLAYRLKRQFKDPFIQVLNLGLGGQTSYWGRSIASDFAAPLKPDLVLIAFGMNDFWSVTPREFADTIRSMIADIRKDNPNAEFALISSIPFDPQYTKQEDYMRNISGYARALAELRQYGVAFVDMYEIGLYLSGIKGHKSLTVDPMHPNDYFARWYADRVASLFDM